MTENDTCNVGSGSAALLMILAPKIGIWWQFDWLFGSQTTISMFRNWLRDFSKTDCIIWPSSSITYQALMQRSSKPEQSLAPPNDCTTSVWWIRMLLRAFSSAATSNSNKVDLCLSSKPQRAPSVCVSDALHSSPHQRQGHHIIIPQHPIQWLWPPLHHFTSYSRYSSRFEVHRIHQDCQSQKQHAHAVNKPQYLSRKKPENKPENKFIRMVALSIPQQANNPHAEPLGCQLHPSH